MSLSTREVLTVLAYTLITAALALIVPNSFI